MHFEGFRPFSRRHVPPDGTCLQTAVARRRHVPRYSVTPATMAEAAEERPLWAAAHDQFVKHEQGGIVHLVPPSVKQRLDAPTSVVPGKEAPATIFKQFTVTVAYEPPANPATPPDVKCVKVTFRAEKATVGTQQYKARVA